MVNKQDMALETILNSESVSIHVFLFENNFLKEYVTCSDITNTNRQETIQKT